jgi:hypothetical protein
VSTVAVVTARLRIDLQESVANQWLEATLERCVNDAHKEVAPLFGSIERSGWFEETETFTVAASTETYDLSGLSRVFAAIKSLWLVRSAGDEARVSIVGDAKFREFSRSGTVSADVVPVYSLRRAGGTEYLHLLPLAGATRTFRIVYRYDPPTLTSGQSLHTPARYDPLIAAIAKRNALAIVGEEDTSLQDHIDMLTAKMFDAEGASASESVPQRITEDHVADVFQI